MEEVGKMESEKEHGAQGKAIAGAEKIRSYCLVQVKSAENPRNVAEACKSYLGIYGVVAANATSGGLFDVILKIEGTLEEEGRALDDIRENPGTEFAAPLRITQVYAAEGQLIMESAIFS
jgi:hypothetical protein